MGPMVWRRAWVFVGILALVILAFASRSSNLLQDTDTRVMITRIHERQAPFSWFAGDWPLQNHFYRPIVALTFELDSRLYGWNPHGYAFTNALLCALAMAMLFWLIREAFEDAVLAMGSALVYSLFTIGYAFREVSWLLTCVGVASALAILVWRRDWRKAILCLLVSVAASGEALGVGPFNGGMMEWIPGRTASTMAIFAFASVAAYARFERLSSQRDPVPASPLDPPNTRMSQQTLRSTAWPWLVVSVASLWCATASYEQAIMVPALVLGTAIAMRLRGVRVRWASQVPIWAMLVIYWAERQMLLPSGTSAYQRQQFRTGEDVYFSIADYLFPPARAIRETLANVQTDPLAIINCGHQILLTAAWIGLLAWAILRLRSALERSKRTYEVALTFAFVASGITFLPMAWLKPFSYNHYHYAPMGFRAVFFCSLLILLGKLILSGISRPVLQAPPRPSPAPGSLPRR